MSHAPLDVLAAIGHTPLIRLRRASEGTGCEIYGKAEFLNPGLSVKDRARSHRADAEARGPDPAGRTIVEGTAGNTGIGLAMVASCAATPRLIVIPRHPVEEKKQTLRLAGARADRGAGGALRRPQQLVHVSGRLAEQLAATSRTGAHLGQPVRQRRQPPGPRRTTGPEIWAQAGGQVDGFICAVGPAARWPASPRRCGRATPVKIGLADPYGRGALRYYTTGD